jgi:outer membrane protein assembly factor BamD
MRFSQSTLRTVVCLAAVLSLVSTSCFRKKKYENPITKDTQQPDKVLFDKAIADIERSRYEVARLTLNTLMNTYDTSEYLAKAKLAIADSWYQEGGTHGLSQAEAEYKDFILFYPNMEESAEAQEKVCMIHFKQMEKADRDPKHAMRAEDECRLLLTQFPNSKYAPEAQQRLREIQEVLAQHEYVSGSFYHHKGSFFAASNRLQGLADAYPLFSQADEALWKLGDSYAHMGAKFADKSAAAYARIVKDYPLSPFAEDAKGKLEQMEKPIPQADPVAYARMKYELENRTKTSLLSRGLDLFGHAPDVSMAAKSGTPPADGLRPTTPANVPVVAAVATGATGDVGIQTVSDTSALDSKPDARAIPPAAQGAAPTAPAGAAPATTATPAATPDKAQDPNAEAASKPADQATASSATTSKKKKKKKNTPPPPAQ